MAVLKIAMTIDDKILKRLDILAKSKISPNCGNAIQQKEGVRFMLVAATSAIDVHALNIFYLKPVFDGPG